MLERLILEWAESDDATDRAGKVATTWDSSVRAEIRDLIKNNLLEDANRIVMELLRSRIQAGDDELEAVMLLLQHFRVIIARQPPLSHLESIPLHPNGALYECFDQFIDLIGRQNKQIGEMSAIIAELI